MQLKKKGKMFKKLLVATELVDFCDAPVLTALRIAEQNDAQLSILHVLESGTAKERHLVKHFRTGEDIVVSGEYEETVKNEIEKSCSGALESGGNYTIKVTSGFPWKEILRLAKKDKTDLILLGPHTGRAKELGVVRTKGKIGSAVQGVIMHERCPVMITNRNISEEKLKFKQIVIGTDFSESCKNALLFAIKLAQTHDSKVFIFHMAPVPPCPNYSQADYDKDISRKKQKLVEFCRVIPTEIEYDFDVWGGAHPHLEILKCAGKKEADLIVMGSHTKEKGGKWYVGSAVEGVSYRSVCPVVVITDPKVLPSVA
jgi:nucleotide-binding universal stress UspA family protein